MKGKIVLVPFPFTDLTTVKLRPALVLYEGDQDVVVAFISSRVQALSFRGGVLVSMDHPEFSFTGLKVSSVIRLDKICTILKDLIVGEMGEIGVSIRGLVNEAIRELYLV